MAAKPNKRTAQDKPPIAVKNNFREMAVWCYHFSLENITPMTKSPILSQNPFVKLTTTNPNKKCQLDTSGFKPMYRPPVQTFKLNMYLLSAPLLSFPAAVQEKNKKQDLSSKKSSCWPKNSTNSTLTGGSTCKESQGYRLFSHQASIAETLQLYREQYIYPRNVATKSEQRLLDQTVSEVMGRRRQCPANCTNKNNNADNLPPKRQSPPARVKMKGVSTPKMENVEMSKRVKETEATSTPQSPPPKRPPQRVVTRRRLYSSSGRCGGVRRNKLLPPPKCPLPIAVVTLGLDTTDTMYQPPSVHTSQLIMMRSFPDSQLHRTRLQYGF